MIAGQVGDLLDVVEDVLAEAGPVAQAPQQVEDLSGQARDARVVGGCLSGLTDEDVDLGPGLLHDILDASRVDPAVADELGQGEAGDLAADRVEAAEHDRVRGVVDDEVDARGLLEGADVAALAADDAALHLIGRDRHGRDGGLCRVVHHDPLDGSDDDVASAIVSALTRCPLDGPDEADRVVLGLLAHLFDEDRLRLLGGESADALEGLDLLGSRRSELTALVLELLLALEQLAAALFQHVRALVQLLVALQEAALEVGHVVPLGATFLIELAMEADLLFLGLEDELLLLGPRLGHDALGLLGRGLDGLGCDEAARHEADDEPANGHHEEDDRHDDGFVHLSLPSGPSGRT